MNNAIELAVRRKIDKCLSTASLVFEANRTTKIAAADSVNHAYDDKYKLSEQLTNTSLSCLFNGFQQLGISLEHLNTLKAWSLARSVSLSFSTEVKCRFVKEIEREEEDPTRVQMDGVLGRLAGNMRVITKVKHYVFAVEMDYHLVAFSGVGTDPSETITLQNRNIKKEITLRSNNPPFKECVKETEDVNITWMLKQLTADTTTTTDEVEFNFTIDRTQKDCYTPRQNRNTLSALLFFRDVTKLFQKMDAFLTTLHDFQSQFATVPTPKLTDFHGQDVFIPIVPLFEEENPQQDVVVHAAGGQSVVLRSSTASALIAEQKRSLEAKCTEAADVCAGSVHTTFTATEARLQVSIKHLRLFHDHFQHAVDYIEKMIRAQLVAAIGKELTPKDFAQYMTFHHRKVFREEYQPRPFSFAVRRSSLHSPEGQVQIESEAVSPAEPIYTVSHVAEEAPFMEFALNATSTVKFGGERHLHGWMAHRFSGQSLPALRLVAQARQFSSYIVLIGRIGSAKVFQPKYGFIVQNKDELTIPLELEQIPTAKEFTDAISSLSPEQQRFAKAYRSMQLESTLFGVCVIQIKPQLEKVLKLPADSLTKEIKLTQDLMQLFIKYQIPTDLLSFDPATWQGPGGEASAADRVLAVKKHVQAMQEMLLAAKEEDIAEKELQRDYLHGRVDKLIGMDDCFDQLTDQCDLMQEETIAFNSKPSGMRRKSAGFGGRASTTRATNSAPMMKGGRGGPGGGGGPELSMKKCRKAVIAAPAENQRAASASGGGGGSVVTTKATTAVNNPPSITVPTSQTQIDMDVEHKGVDVEQVDYTRYPSLLEEMYSKYDPDSSLRPTIINPGSSWTKRAQASLLSAPVSSTLGSDEQAREKSAAFDLLDALTRSGALPIEHASLHVVIAATHCFDQSIVDTLVQRNVNPIERVERSTLIMAATLHGCQAASLVQDSQLERLQTYSPGLVLLENQGEDADI